MTEDMKKDSLPVEEETVETVEPVETAAEKPAVLVRDVMEKVFVSVTPDTPIRRISPFYQTSPPGRTGRRRKQPSHRPHFQCRPHVSQLEAAYSSPAFHGHQSVYQPHL